MKNKKQIWITGPLVLIIWGVIAYRIYVTMKGNSQPVSVSQVPQYFENSPEDSVKYTLQLNYDDPFLKNRKVVVAQTNTPQPAARPAKKIIKTVTKVPVRWPAIIYRGLITKKDSRTTLFLIEVEGRSYIFKKGETIQDLTLLETYTDSVKLEYRKEEKKIFKKE